MHEFDGCDADGVNGDGVGGYCAGRADCFVTGIGVDESECGWGKVSGNGVSECGIGEPDTGGVSCYVTRIGVDRKTGAKLMGMGLVGMVFARATLVSVATSPGSGSTGTALMGTEAAGMRLLGALIAGACALGATSPFDRVTAGLGGAQTGMCAVGAWSAGAGVVGRYTMGVHGHAFEVLIGAAGVHTGSLVHSVMVYLVAEVVRVVGTAFADPVRVGSADTLLGTGLSGTGCEALCAAGLRSTGTSLVGSVFVNVTLALVVTSPGSGSTRAGLAGVGTSLGGVGTDVGVTVGGGGLPDPFECPFALGMTSKVG
jgi:hypothetical protein